MAFVGLCRIQWINRIIRLVLTELSNTYKYKRFLFHTHTDERTHTTPYFHRCSVFLIKPQFSVCDIKENVMCVFVFVVANVVVIPHCCMSTSIPNICLHKSNRMKCAAATAASTKNHKIVLVRAFNFIIGVWRLKWVWETCEKNVHLCVPNKLYVCVRWTWWFCRFDRNDPKSIAYFELIFRTNMPTAHTVVKWDKMHKILSVKVRVIKCINRPTDWLRNLQCIQNVLASIRHTVNPFSESIHSTLSVDNACFVCKRHWFSFISNQIVKQWS